MEMLRTFNMSIGLTIVTKEKYADNVINHITLKGINCYKIGNIVKGNKTVQVKGSFNW